MANLSDYKYGYSDAEKVPAEVIFYNTSTDPENGGICCLWSVPGGVNIITGQLWGGGGSGDANCSTSTGWPGAAGGFVEFAQGVEGGSNLTVCIAGTTARPASRTNAVDGFDSYICLENEWCIFAGGGCRGCVCGQLQCITGWCKSFCCNNSSASTSGSDGTIDYIWYYPGANSERMVDVCHCRNHHQLAPSGFGQPARIGARWHYDSVGNTGLLDGLWPGGGGFSAQSQGSTCGQGGAGAGGALYLLFM